MADWVGLRSLTLVCEVAMEALQPGLCTGSCFLSVRAWCGHTAIAVGCSLLCPWLGPYVVLNAQHCVLLCSTRMRLHAAALVSCTAVTLVQQPVIAGSVPLTVHHNFRGLVLGTGYCFLRPGVHSTPLDD